jgi:hypothetical protein
MLQHPEFLFRTGSREPQASSPESGGGATMHQRRHSLGQRGPSFHPIGNGFNIGALTGLKPQKSARAIDGARDCLKQRRARDGYINPPIAHVSGNNFFFLFTSFFASLTSPLSPANITLKGMSVVFRFHDAAPLTSLIVGEGNLSVRHCRLSRISDLLISVFASSSDLAKRYHPDRSFSEVLAMFQHHLMLNHGSEDVVVVHQPYPKPNPTDSVSCTAP